MPPLKILQKITKKGTLPLEFIIILAITAILVIMFIVFVLSNIGSVGG